MIEKNDRKGVGRKVSPEHPAQKIIRTAGLIREGGQSGNSSSVPIPSENLGLMIGLLRRRKRWSIEYLANKIACSEEILIALEAGALPIDIAIQILPGLIKVIGVDPRVVAKLIEYKD